MLTRHPQNGNGKSSVEWKTFARMHTEKVLLFYPAHTLGTLYMFEIQLLQEDLQTLVAAPPLERIGPVISKLNFFLAASSPSVISPQRLCDLLGAGPQAALIIEPCRGAGGRI